MYEGEWARSLRHGYGVWKRFDKKDNEKVCDSYIGEWRYGKAEGYGVHVWNNGD